MKRSPTHWSRPAVLLIVSAMVLATMVGCQGFSSGKAAGQGAPQPASSEDLTPTPSSITFGNVQVGTSQSQTDTLTNTGGSTLTLSQATTSGAGFSFSGFTLPVTLAAGQSTTVSILFAPSSVGAANGSLSLTDDSSGTPLVLPLSGNAVAVGSLVGTPTSFSFGTVQVGASQTQTETLTNTGGESLTITQAAVTGIGFSDVGLTFPLILTPGQSSTFNVVFAPSIAGASNGLLSLTVGGSTTTFDMALSGTGATPASLTANPSTLTFKGVEVGKSQTQSATVTNIGGSAATISQDSVAGTGFSISGLNTPFTLFPGQSATVNVTFAPLTSGSVSGSVAIASNATNSNLVISLNGSATGGTQGQLSVSPTTISVGNVTVGLSGSQSGTITASVATVTVSSASVASSEFTISGLSFPVVLHAGQSANFTVTFTPQSSGLASASASFTSDASNSIASFTVAGTGVAAPVYNVNLSWTASTSPKIVGYNVYRRTGTSGSFAQINSTLDALTSYNDTTVIDGQTYYYETTAVNSSGEESAASQSVRAVIPAP